jgi:hypothetical protein
LKGLGSSKGAFLLGLQCKIGLRQWIDGRKGVGEIVAYAQANHGVGLPSFCRFSLHHSYFGAHHGVLGSPHWYSPSHGRAFLKTAKSPKWPLDVILLDSNMLCVHPSLTGSMDRKLNRSLRPSTPESLHHQIVVSAHQKSS